jgi:hypothetical protein
MVFHFHLWYLMKILIRVLCLMLRFADFQEQYCRKEHWQDDRYRYYNDLDKSKEHKSLIWLLLISIYSWWTNTWLITFRFITVIDRYVISSPSTDLLSFPVFSHVWPLLLLYKACWIKAKGKLWQCRWQKTPSCRKAWTVTLVICHNILLRFFGYVCR